MNRRTLLATLGAAATASTAGCAARCPPADDGVATAPGTAPHGDPTNAGRAAAAHGPGDDPSTRSWDLWEFASTDPVELGRAASPVAEESSSFVATGLGSGGADRGAGDLFAVDPAEREPAWIRRLPGGAAASPALVDGRVVVPAGDGSLLAFDAGNGGEAWRHKTRDRVRCPPAVVEGAVYAGSDVGSVRSLDARTGNERWRTGIGGRVRSLAVTGGRVFAGVDVGRDEALSAPVAGTVHLERARPSRAANGRTPSSATG